MIENVFPDALIADVQLALATSASATFAIVGHTPATYDLMRVFQTTGQWHRLVGVYDASFCEESAGAGFRPLEALRGQRPTYVAVAVDDQKQEVLASLEDLVPIETRLLFAGEGQYSFRDETYHRARNTALVPSFATGYPNTLIHIYECLRNAARLELDGVVVEFGMFKGGTTMLLSRFVRALGQKWPVIGFDTFSGFPPKRSLFDMYDHPDCRFDDLESVRRLVEGHGVEIVPGDIVETVERLRDEKIVLAFIDTDNFTPASAAVASVQERVVVGGAIVFDHYTGRKRHRYTLGERMAARPLEQDRRYFNLHDTGVFLRQV